MHRRGSELVMGISSTKVDPNASPKQLLNEALLACDHVRSHTSADIPESPLGSPQRFLSAVLHAEEGYMIHCLLKRAYL